MCGSFFPLILGVSNAGNNPLGFAAIFGFGIAIGIMAFVLLMKQYRECALAEFRCFIKQLIGGVGSGNYNGIDSRVIRFWYKHLFLCVLFGRFYVLFYAWGTRFTDTAIAAMLFEAEIIILVILRKFDRKRRKMFILKGHAFILLGFSLIGLLLINYSESGSVFRIGFGTTLVLIAALLSAINVDRSLAFGEAQEIKPEIWSNTDNDAGEKVKQFVYSLLVVAVTHLVSGIVFSFIIMIQVMITDNHLSYYLQMDYMPLVIIFVLTFGSGWTILLRAANLITFALEINGIRYFTPVLGLIWLVSLSDVHIVRPVSFITGAVLVIATNAILQTRNQARDQEDVVDREKDKFGLTALVLSIWSVGFIVLYRDRWLGYWVDSWQWDGSTDYFSLLGLSATVFILILSFRTLQLNDIKRLEDQLAFSLYQKFEVLGCNSKMKIENEKETQEMLELVNDPDTEDDKDTLEMKIIKKIDKSIPQQSLERMKQYLHKSLKIRKDSLKKQTELLELSKLSEDINYLVHSKSRGRGITEPLVLILFAIMTTTIALFTRPYFAEWNAFINDIFSVLFASAIAFLTINLFDQKRERKQSIFVSSSAISKSWVDIWLPVLGCAFLVFTFVVILYGKWLGDWSWTSELVSKP